MTTAGLYNVIKTTLDLHVDNVIKHKREPSAQTKIDVKATDYLITSFGGAIRDYCGSDAAMVFFDKATFAYVDVAATLKLNGCEDVEVEEAYFEAWDRVKEAVDKLAMSQED